MEKTMTKSTPAQLAVYLHDPLPIRLERIASIVIEWTTAHAILKQGPSFDRRFFVFEAPTREDQHD
jgi:hypothetical protein